MEEEAGKEEREEVSAEQIGGVAMMGLSLASTSIILQAAEGLVAKQTKLTQFDKPKPKSKILRQNHKPVFRVLAYESKRHGLVVPKRDIFQLPSTATSALGTFFHPESKMPLAYHVMKMPESPQRTRRLKESQVVLKADTVRKMILG